MNNNNKKVFTYKKWSQVEVCRVPVFLHDNSNFEFHFIRRRGLTYSVGRILHIWLFLDFCTSSTRNLSVCDVGLLLHNGHKQDLPLWILLPNKCKV